jgi:formate hydrogenlyase transcriptional activator
MNSPSGRAFRARRTLVFHDDELTQFADAVSPLRQYGIRVLCCAPVVARDVALGTLAIGSCEPDAFSSASVAVIDVLGHHVAMAIGDGLTIGESVQRNHDDSVAQRIVPESHVPGLEPFEGIVGNSRPLRDALQHVDIVAQTEATVLILGETGTGKELIARAIHNRSARRGRPFVTINCAAIPSGLIESELFGHERGAFTGAIAQKIGRFEEAKGGTLFLDEIGEIPLELQPKLLRALQDHEFVRIGGTRTTKVDVRVVAATNRDLAEMVEEHGFRGDLYYRLNVFPIRAPSLRERPEDIEPLVRHFVQRVATRMQRRIEVIPSETLEMMRLYPWPGNVRELENVIERAVILSAGPRLIVPPESLTRRLSQDDGASTLDLVKRDHVVRVLEMTNWVVGGPWGAAARLGLKPTTLQSLMKRYAIARDT